MSELTAPPVLSTPDDSLRYDLAESLPGNEQGGSRRTDEDLNNVYEIARTAREIRDGRRRCVALQFPDTMLQDAPRVVGLLKAELATLRAAEADDKEEKVYILADTSYSACCVDEVAAQHGDADVVVHYGRSCMSPTSRLPVVYVFTKHPLDVSRAAAAFRQTFPGPESARVVLVADVTYQDHVPALATALQALGYKNLLSTTVVHNPAASIPSRRLVDTATGEALADDAVPLQDYAIFHISNPPTALLLALSARVQSFYVYPTAAEEAASSSAEPPPVEPAAVLQTATTGLLGRRYAKVLQISRAGVIGILVNTLSVRNYLAAVATIRQRIANAGKKSYLMVVGKLNPVKLANFAEIEAWVVVGCWESSLVEEDAGSGAGSFYQPVVTPFELEMALQSDDQRIWGLEWMGGIEGIRDGHGGGSQASGLAENADADAIDDVNDGTDFDDEEDSAPPEFDLRTGKLITTSRPMLRWARVKAKAPQDNSENANNGDVPPAASDRTLALRGKAELASIRGVASPGAEYLRSQRTWQGLGTEFSTGGDDDGDDDEETPSTLIEEGRSGVARGYTVGDETDRT